MKCDACGKEISEDALFCSFCGSKLVHPEPSESPAEIEPLANLQVRRLAFRWTRKNTLITVGAFVAVALMFGVSKIGGSTSSLGSTDSQEIRKTLSKSFSTAEIASVLTECSDINERVAGTRSTETLKAKIKKYSKISDVSKARAVTENWGILPFAEINAYKSAVFYPVNQRFDALVKKYQPNIDASTAEKYTMKKDLLDQWLSKCGIAESYQSHLDTLESLSSVHDKLAALVANAPWYPSGFSEYQDGIAVKWVSQSCSYLSCWHMKLVTRDGCMSGLYAEINILDKAGNVIDYSNDTVPRLSARSTAILEFNTGNDYARSAELVKVNCY